MVPQMAMVSPHCGAPAHHQPRACLDTWQDALSLCACSGYLCLLGQSSGMYDDLQGPLGSGL